MAGAEKEKKHLQKLFTTTQHLSKRQILLPTTANKAGIHQLDYSVGRFQSGLVKTYLESRCPFYTGIIVSKSGPLFTITLHQIT